MASSSNSVSASAVQPAPQAVAEDNGYVKRAVMAIVNAVRWIFEKIANFFACCFSFSDDRPVASQASSSLAREAPLSPLASPSVPPLSRDEIRWKALKYTLTPGEYLEMLESSKFSLQERDDVYVKLAEENRARSSTIGQVFNSYVRGDAREHKINQGKQIAKENPSLLVPYLRQKI